MVVEQSLEGARREMPLPCQNSDHEVGIAPNSTSGELKSPAVEQALNPPEVEDSQEHFTYITGIRFWLMITSSGFKVSRKAAECVDTISG